METPKDPADTRLQRLDDSDHPIARSWVTTLLGVGVLGFTWYWLDNPSAQGLGRILRFVYKGGGKWPIALVFAAGGVYLLSTGVSGILRRHAQKR
jgi:hypothetical protein